MSYSTEKLIACVKNYPILYDNTNRGFSNSRRRDEVWQELSEKLGAKPNELKKKWKNLCDFYVKYLRTEANDVSYAAWSWAQHMRPFRPYLSTAARELHSPNETKRAVAAVAPISAITAKHFTKFESESSEEDVDEEEDQGQHNSASNFCAQFAAPSKTASPQYRQKAKRLKQEVKQKEKSPPPEEPSPVEPDFLKTCQEQLPQQEQTEFDDTRSINESELFAAAAAAQLSANEHLFLGFAKIVDTFSARRQATIKRKIANIVFEEELFECDETEEPLYSSQHYLDTESALH